ncbi:MAG: FAD-dependent monooxygenase [Phycisphaerales bacterium]|nr:FAD-dependent monooxygenase [Phycisphaerales bacterium]
MSMAERRRITIIGAGPAGALMAIYLARGGYDVTVYERLPDPRIHGFTGGRSINLALSARGIAALAEVGLTQRVLENVIPMPGRMIHSPTGHLTFQPYSANPNDRINSVSRAGLSLILLEAAASHPNVKLLFDHRCVAIDFKKSSAAFARSASKDQATVDVDTVIGADGAFSAVRLQMMLNMDRLEYNQSYLEHGYKELTIPPAAQCGVDPGRFGGFAMNPNALHIWPRGGYMMIALPNQDRSFTCTCFWPFAGPTGFESLKTDADIPRFFEAHFPDAVPLMPTLVHDFKHNPTGSLVTVHCWPWHLSDKALLVGDAAHAIVPFYGQGMNCAFEDCSVLNQCISQHAPDWGSVFKEFAAQRKPNTDAIAEMALHNFIEMRDHTASRVFRMKKKFGQAMHRLFPQWFMPLYNMISFSTIPYAQAQRRAATQSRTLKFVGWFLLAAFAIVIGLVLTLP